MTNPSTVWTQLAVPNPAAKAVPFIDDDNSSVIIDALNFYYNKAADSTINGTIISAQLTVLNGFRVKYTDGTVVPIANGGNITINSISGRVQLLAGVASFTITNSMVFATSMVKLQMVVKDTGVVVPLSATPAAGSFLVTMSAVTVSANVQIDFEVVNRY